MIYDHTWTKAAIAADARKLASRLGVFDGTPRTEHVLRRCIHRHDPSGTMLIFTYDSGHHTCGWFKNPDYERCLHLSLSFFDPDTQEARERDARLTKEWIGAFFGGNADMLWCEPPYYGEGKAREVWHYRLFCDPAWQPIIPRGEVYSTEFTESGWKSYSDVHADLEQEAVHAAI